MMFPPSICLFTCSRKATPESGIYLQESEDDIVGTAPLPFSPPGPGSGVQYEALRNHIAPAHYLKKQL